MSVLSQTFYALAVPPAPTGAPEYLERLLARLQAAHEAGATRVAREALRDTVGFLTRYFGMVLGAGSRRLGCPQADVGGTREAGEVIHSSLIELLRTADPMAVALRSVFFREQPGGGFLPFPHTKLLLRDGLLASGSQTLMEWLASSCEPESDDSCRAEVNDMLPVLRAWLQAAAPFFREARYDYLVQPRHAYQATALRGLEGGRRVSMQSVQLVTRFRDLQSGMPLRTRDMQEAPAQPALDTAPLADLVRDMLAKGQAETAPAVIQAPVRPLRPKSLEQTRPRKEEFDFVLTAAPIAAGAVLLYLLMLAL